MADSVKIRITGDDSDFRRTLDGLEAATGDAIRRINRDAASLWSGIGGSAAGPLPVSVSELNIQLADELSRSAIELGGEVARALNEQLSAQMLRLNATADLRLALDGTDPEGGDAAAAIHALGQALNQQLKLLSSNVAATAEGTGAAIAKDIVSGLASKNDAIRQAGAQAGQGFNAGLVSQRAAILATARNIATSAAAVIRSALQIHSPSRVTMRLGEYAGLGFDAGLQQSLQSAVRHAQGIVSELNLSPTIAAPEQTGAFAGAAEAISSAADRPINLILDGRVVARTLAPETARAANARNRNIALGVGK